MRFGPDGPPRKTTPQGWVARVWAAIRKYEYKLPTRDKGRV